MNESTLFDLLPGYALDALSDEEKAQVEAFLATSEAARAELRTYQDMMAGMATLVPPRRSPAHLTEDFRQRLAQSAAGSVEKSAPVIQMPDRRVETIRRLRWVVGIAALIGFILGVFVVYRVITGEIEARTVSQILSDPHAKWITLAAQPGASGKVSFVVVSTSTKAVLVAQLPPLPAQKQYQLWLINNTERDSGGVFSTDQSTKRILVNMPDVPSKYQKLGITVEPYGGSPGPTTSPVFTGLFTQ